MSPGSTRSSSDGWTVRRSPRRRATGVSWKRPPRSSSPSVRPTKSAGTRTTTRPKSGGDVDVVDHVRVGEQVGDAHAHLALGEHDAIRPDAFEDGAVERRPGLGNDVADAELLERHRREHARFAAAADRDDRVVELPGADALERLEVGGVELQGLGHLRRDLVDGGLVAVHGEHVVPEAHELAGRRGAEPPEADDENGLLHRGSPGQPMRTGSTAGRWVTGRVRWASARTRTSGPSRPTNIAAINISWPPGENWVVRPVDTPDRAERRDAFEHDPEERQAAGQLERERKRRTPPRRRRGRSRRSGRR